ncbi:MAG TPA: amino acid permease [Anaerovoracaceae bacterium]|nr:amino acid permease [Anaerovoracaceae bacterium]
MEENKLKRALKRRHITMIAIGGTIGTGLFLTSGYNIQKAGALGGPLAYLLIGILVYVLMKGVGEMSTFLPTSGAYQTFAGLFVHPIFGFAVGWNVWVNASISIGAELVAGAMILNQFFPAVHPVIWCLVIGGVILALNLISVNTYGEAEFWFAGIKVVTIVIFMITGILMIAGVVGQGGPIGFSNWSGDALFPNGFLSVFFVAAAVIWSYLGVETVTIAAGETENPEKNVPLAINTVFFRIVLFYVGSVTIMSLVVPYTEVSIMQNGYAGLFALAGLTAASVIMNVVILTSLSSCANSVVYIASRILMALSQEGKAPKVFASVNKRGVPSVAIIVTMAMGLVSLATSFASPDRVFVWIISIAGFNTLLTWFGILLSHLYFRKWLVNNGGKVENLKFKTKYYPIPTILGLAFLILIAIVTAISPDNRFSFFIGVPMMLIYFGAGIYVYKKGNMVPPDYKDYLNANINDKAASQEK